MIHNRRTQIGLRLAYIILMTCPVWAQQSSSIPTSVPYAGATISDFKGPVKLQTPAQGPISPTRGLTLPPPTIVITERGTILLPSHHLIQPSYLPRTPP